VPHVNIKHFPKDFTEDQKNHLAEDLTAIITKHFDVADDAVSIALDPVTKPAWNESVIIPEISGRDHLLIKAPNY
jgi:4-oxalocrotonate tautomerase